MTLATRQSRRVEQREAGPRVGRQRLLSIAIQPCVEGRVIRHQRSHKSSNRQHKRVCLDGLHYAAECCRQILASRAQHSPRLHIAGLAAQSLAQTARQRILQPHLDRRMAKQWNAVLDFQLPLQRIRPAQAADICRIRECRSIATVQRSCRAARNASTICECQRLYVTARARERVVQRKRWVVKQQAAERNQRGIVRWPCTGWKCTRSSSAVRFVDSHTQQQSEAQPPPNGHAPQLCQSRASPPTKPASAARSAIQARNAVAGAEVSALWVFDHACNAASSNSARSSSTSTNRM